MLRIRFWNVGDGDAILIEELSGGRVFRMLVDTGVGPLCAEHLRRSGIDRLDRIVITHLHADHIGGLSAVNECCAAGELICGYIPLRAGAQAAPEPRADKPIRNMIACLNQFSADAALLREKGCRMTELYDSWHGVRLTENLSADFRIGVDVIFEYRLNSKPRACAILALHDVAQVADKIPAHKALRTGNEDVH